MCGSKRGNDALLVRSLIIQNQKLITVPMRKKQSPFIITLTTLFVLLLSIFTVEGAKKTYGVVGSSNGNVKLFVFGDSYVDTGNFIHSQSYKPPCGITFPGHPGGRFCDGRVLTDYLALYLKIDSPIPNAYRNASNIQNGINFAYGGTGVFDTHIDGPNLTAQINTFEQLIQQNLYTKTDLQSSFVLVNAGGNDYTAHIQHGSFFDIPKFTKSLVEQLARDIKRIQSLGVGKVAVSLIQPMGCLPELTVIDMHMNCIDLVNKVSQNHNQLLNDAIKQFNTQAGKTVLVTLDLYNAFLSAIDTMNKAHDRNSSLMNPLEECCVANMGHECGDVDEKGAKQYKVCQNPNLAFFWDTVHPSQNGWNAIFTLLQPSIAQFTLL
ncbi:GDSL esterase/lipase At5g03610 [Arachis hypogaea]|nr:GDSL esterase/lipase At5g03610 [Arachis hypogaea]QHO35517.1 GDSL esterase/lipase [Arachis hypogaea]